MVLSRVMVMCFTVAKILRVLKQERGQDQLTKGFTVAKILRVLKPLRQNHIYDLRFTVAKILRVLKRAFGNVLDKSVLQ